MRAEPALLRLKAEDRADLEVMSAAAQDAIVRAGDLAFDSKGRRFAAVLNRFRWEAAGRQGPYSRTRALLTVEHALAVRSQRLRRDAPDAVASLLAIRFAPDTEPPSGVLSLALAGGGVVEVQVEALEATLADLGPIWPTALRPDHRIEET